MSVQSRNRRGPVPILVIAGLILLALGGWRLATRFSGHHEHYLWLDIEQLEDHLQEVTAAREKTRAELEAKDDSMTREQRGLKESDQKNQEQLVRDLTGIRAAKIDAAAGQELRLGFFSTLLGLGSLGTAAYLLVRRP